MMISEKMVFTSSNGNHLVLYARPPAGISIQKCSVRSSFLLNEKAGAAAPAKKIYQINCCSFIISLNCRPSFSAAFRHKTIRLRNISK